MIQLTINGKPVSVPENTTVLQAARREGIEIPTLCDHPDLTPYGGCRLCIVEVKGARVPQTACTLPASQGMVVATDTPAIHDYRRAILKMLLSAYYDSGYLPEAEETEFAHLASVYGLDIQAEMGAAPRFPIDSDPNPFIWVDQNKCILCTRCIRACAEVQGRFVWGSAGRGFNTHIAAGADVPLLEARCESCGACVAYCPTGALDHKLSLDAGVPDRKVTTTCTYCGVGCQFDLNVKDDHIIRVTSNPDAPVNGMALCVKGRFGYDFVHHPERLLKPRVRKGLLEGTPTGGLRREDDWVEVSWETALDLTARKLAQVQMEHGSNAIGVLTSAKCTNEENYLMNKFARQVVGTNSIDHCARL